ncbi:MAG: cob(I)yrinic acid a,c-diamide adenosyltransferase [Gammaproteobacteria bacterium]|nr:cob(I)yrinic acid a,c-diamide adenosyltransferase [Gammaproteobacteria bacterium]
MAKAKHRITKVTTRQGDGGKSRLADGKQLAKDEPIFNAIGDVDELNSHLGVLVNHLNGPDLEKTLQEVQQQLFDLGAYLATVGQIPAPNPEPLEAHIETMNAALPPLTEFVLPGGSAGAAQAHVCRSVCRRAERSLWHADQQDGARYLNRLSDLFFVLARALNAQADLPEDLWRGSSPRPG